MQPLAAINSDHPQNMNGADTLQPVLQVGLDQSPTAPCSWEVSPASWEQWFCDSRSSIRTFSFYPIRWGWADLDVSTSTAGIIIMRSVSLPDGLRPALHCNSSVSAIRLYEQAGFARTSVPPHELFGTPLFTMEKVIVSAVDSRP